MIFSFVLFHFTINPRQKVEKYPPNFSLQPAAHIVIYIDVSRSKKVDKPDVIEQTVP